MIFYSFLLGHKTTWCGNPPLIGTNTVCQTFLQVKNHQVRVEALGLAVFTVATGWPFVAETTVCVLDWATFRNIFGS